MESDRAVLAAVAADDVAGLSATLTSTPAAAGARDDRGVSALMHALYRRQPSTIEMLVRFRSDFDVFEAASLGRVQQLESMLATEPSLVRAVSGDGFTPLHLAAFFDRPEAARVLIQHAADIEAIAANPSRVRPIHSAAANGSAGEVLPILLRSGASIDAAQHGGWTALQARARHGDVAAVRLLLSHGANPRLAADDGKTAVDLAREAGRAEVVALLEEVSPQ